MNECNDDGQCPSSAPDSYWPTLPKNLCCEDIRVIIGNFCSGVKSSVVASLPALTGCAEKPNCVAQAQRLPTTTPPPPKPTPTPAPANQQVKLSLTLAMPLADFNASIQQTLKEQLAVAAGLPRSDAAARVLIAFRAAAARRRLLAAAAAGSVAVDVTISMPDSASASKAVQSLSAGSINTHLAAAGLPPATVTSTAALGSTAAPLSSGAAPAGTRMSPGRLATAAGGVLAALALANRATAAA